MTSEEFDDFIDKSRKRWKAVDRHQIKISIVMLITMVFVLGYMTVIITLHLDPLFYLAVPIGMLPIMIYVVVSKPKFEDENDKKKL